MALIIDNIIIVILSHIQIAGHINKAVSIHKNDCTDKLIGRQRVHDFSKIP